MIDKKKPESSITYTCEKDSLFNAQGERYDSLVGRNIKNDTIFEVNNLSE